MPFTPRDLEPFFARLGSHSALDGPALRALRGLPGQIQQIATNRDFVNLGERTSDACYVVEGVVGRFGQTSAGARQIIALDLPGNVANLNSVAVALSGFAMQALSPATIIRVPYRALREAAEANPSIAHAFWRESALDGAKMAHWLTNVGRRDAATGMANLFCELACRVLKGVPRGRVEFRLPITQAHLSDILGLSSVHVNRVLRQLREADLMHFHYRVVVVPNWTNLADWADFTPDYLSLPSLN